MKTLNKTVENHLTLYLQRSQELWKVYTLSMDNWIRKNPNHDGATYEGAFPEVGITKFTKHGIGIRIECGEEIVEFDFLPKHLEKKDFLHIEEVDIYWSYLHFLSINPQSEITEKQWNEAIEKLHKNGVLRKFSWSKCTLITHTAD